MSLCTAVQLDGTPVYTTSDLESFSAWPFLLEPSPFSLGRSSFSQQSYAETNFTGTPLADLLA